MMTKPVETRNGRRMAKPNGSYADEVEKREILKNLLGEITVTPYSDGKALEFEFGINAEALPNVLPSGRANAYIVVAGAGFEPNPPALPIERYWSVRIDL